MSEVGPFPLSTTPNFVKHQHVSIFEAWRKATW